MKLIRRGTFETNSSSTHSITMCIKSDFDKWVNGEMYWNRWNEEIVSKEEAEEDFNKRRQEFIEENPDFDENDEDWQDELKDYLDCDKTYYTYEEFNNYNYIEFETFVDEYTTPNGETVVSFGYYGNDY